MACCDWQGSEILDLDSHSGPLASLFEKKMSNESKAFREHCSYQFTLSFITETDFCLQKRECR